MLEVDKNTFGPEVLEATGKVVVDFYGDGCVPCQSRAFALLANFLIESLAF